MNLDILKYTNIDKQVLRLEEFIEALEFYKLFLIEEDKTDNPWRGLTTENHLGTLFSWQDKEELKKVMLDGMILGISMYKVNKEEITRINPLSDEGQKLLDNE